MEKKILVYGLGHFFTENKNDILSRYSVVGVSDRDENKVSKFQNGISRTSLIDNIDEYDEILVCANPLSIIPDLIGNLGIPSEKIRVYECEKMMSFLNENEMRFFGERNEDAILMLLVSMLGLRFADIKYLEIGTNNPVIINNSYALYRSGARGILVDAVPFFIPLIKMFRPEDTFIQAAITDDISGEKKSFYLPTTSDGSRCFGIGSLDEKWIDNFKNVSSSTTIEVLTLNVNELFEKAGYVPEVLLIDIEGLDMKVLKAIDFTMYKPLIIMAEIGVVDDDLRSFMKKNGYEVFANIGNCNTIFVSEVHWRARVTV